MSQESNSVNDSQIPAQPKTSGRDEVFDRIAEQIRLSVLHADGLRPRPAFFPA